MRESLMSKALAWLGPVLVIVLAAPACLAAYPEKPIRIVVPYAGGAADAMARVVAAKFSESFRQPVIVENKLGANGTIAVDTIVKSAPDGYNLLYEASTSTFTPYLYRAIPYDLMKDVQPIGQVMTYPYVIVVNPRVPAANVPDLVKYLKASGKEVNVAVGSGSLQVLAELFKQVAGVDFTMVPYKGGGPAVLSLAAGETQMAFQDLPTIAPLVAAGRLRPIAVTSEARTRTLPEIATAKESGLTEFVVMSWHGLFAPANTPPAIVNFLNAELNRILATPDMVKRINGLGADPAPTTVSEFTGSFRSQLIRWKDVTTRAKIPLSD